MAFREEGSLGKFRPYKEMFPGEIVAEGYYEGTVESRFPNPNYQVREANGDLITVNYCGHLAFKMKSAKILIGDYIQIVYAGCEVLAKGNFKGKDSHQVQLFRDPERSLRGGVVPESASKTPRLQEAKEIAASDRVKTFADSLGSDGEMDL